MDKRVIFAVAGSGKTTYIVDNLSERKRSLIVTYTIANYNNLSKKIAEKFNGTWPECITLMTYFTFLYRFCYKPYLSDQLKAKGVFYEINTNKYVNQSQRSYYISPGNYIYSNRLSLLIERSGVIEEVKHRIEKYFDEFVIDEVQDIAGRDFSYLEQLMDANLNMLFVGDFYQHTFDTSRDGNTNKNLFNDRNTYETYFTSKGFICDKTTLIKSWRCSKNICAFVSGMLGIDICSNRPDSDNTTIRFVTDPSEIQQLIADSSIIKLHYKDSARFGTNHRNWGDTKGEDCHMDVCVFLNKTTALLYSKGELRKLAPSTRNKLYVAITRAKGNVYLINE